MDNKDQFNQIIVPHVSLYHNNEMPPYDKIQVDLLRLGMNRLLDRVFDLYEMIEGYKNMNKDWSGLFLEQVKIQVKISEIDLQIHHFYFSLIEITQEPGRENVADADINR